MNVFVCEEINGDQGFLLPDEAYHCYKVLRKVPGDEITMIDGKGNFYHSVIRQISKNSCETEIIDRRQEVDKGYYLHMIVAPTKNISRFEWFLEKSIEIGIDEITPVLCEHSERNRIKTDRLNRIAIGAVKQSLGARFPKLNPLTPISDIMKNVQADYKICAHLMPDQKHLKNTVKKNHHYAVLIGPEGDFSTIELDMLKENHWNFAILGQKRLRTETAAVVATQIINGIHF